MQAPKRPRGNPAKWTEAERRQMKDYNNFAQAKRREKKRAEGMCIVCGVNDPGGGRVTCLPCNHKARAHEAGNPFVMRPSVKVLRAHRRLARAGHPVTVFAILAALANDPEHEFDAEYVRDVLTNHNLI